MIITKKDIAGVVVLFNPDENVLSNIKTYSESLDKLYIIDNSEKESEFLIDIEKLSKTKYLKENGNIGMSGALNKASELAIKYGYKFLLTMDQDSEAPKNMIEKMMEFLNSTDIKNIAIISPFHKYENYRREQKRNGAEEVLVLPTSGNLLNLAAFEKIGKFLDFLFIDYVDIEFCLRARKMGYKIIQLNNVLLKHPLGNLIERNFFVKRIAVTNHSPIRLYYRIRNRIYVIKKYFFTFPGYILSVIKMIFGDIVKIFIYEKYKIEKLKAVVAGLKDGLTNKFGKA